MPTWKFDASIDQFFAKSKDRIFSGVLHASRRVADCVDFVLLLDVLIDAFWIIVYPSSQKLG